MTEKCFADKERGVCTALIKKSCNGCSFYKSEKLHKEDLEKERLMFKELGVNPNYGKY
ncbi:MAG: hypothetical protein RBR71_03655 [Gudongella sp.]|nr:hypothetical protein [Gudongella sp.]